MEISVIDDYFSNSVEVYINRPQVVNRSVGAAVTLYFSHVKDIDLIEHELFEEMSRQLPTCTDLSDELRRILRECLNVDNEISIRKLISKQSSEEFPHEVIISDADSYMFIPIEVHENAVYPVGVSYRLSLDNSSDPPSISMKTFQHQQFHCKTTSIQWLETKLLTKLNKWMITPIAETGSSLIPNDSLRLVDADKYFRIYKSMKDRYRKLCDIWPECTDPLKFVYEDVAIAAYLICIWEAERVELSYPDTYKQKFVDLGCGNGLLVYILSCEGYHGYGIDTRRRRIWSLYDHPTDLRERSITPSDEQLFPDVDWLIGNHSDELTPWIPVMSARSSPSCKFFLLPCCSWDFTSKFERKNASQSVYSQYIEYIYNICVKCSYTIDIDKLRIPSTKKICLIGKIRSCKTPLSNSELQLIISTSSTQRLEDISESGTDMSTSQPDTWSSEFKPREQIERVRNCSTLSHDVKSRIINTIVNELIQTEEYKSLHDGRTWNCGGCLNMKDVVSLFTTETLSKLKSECGGLKTLLKNHHHILSVLPGAHVRLADYSIWAESKSPQLNKTRMCWFIEHHPNGCQLAAEDCRFAHTSEELKPMPPKHKS